MSALTVPILQTRKRRLSPWPKVAPRFSAVEMPGAPKQPISRSHSAGLCLPGKQHLGVSCFSDEVLGKASPMANGSPDCPGHCKPTGQATVGSVEGPGDRVTEEGKTVWRHWAGALEVRHGCGGRAGSQGELGG